MFFSVISISHFMQRCMFLMMNFDDEILTKLMMKWCTRHLKINPPKDNWGHSLLYLRTAALILFYTGVCIKILHVPSSTRVGQSFTFSCRNSCQHLFMCSWSLPSAFWRKQVPSETAKGWKFSLHILARHSEIDVHF